MIEMAKPYTYSNFHTKWFVEKNVTDFLFMPHDKLDNFLYSNWGLLQEVKFLSFLCCKFLSRRINLAIFFFGATRIDFLCRDNQWSDCNFGSTYQVQDVAHLPVLNSRRKHILQIHFHNHQHFQTPRLFHPAHVRAMNCLWTRDELTMMHQLLCLGSPFDHVATGPAVWLLTSRC